MSDTGIKKVIIPKESLPAYNGVNQSYTVKYRVVSEDKNRTSHWSPQYTLTASAQETILFSIAPNIDNNTITVVWNPSSDINKSFDIYIKWDSEDWQYITNVSTTVYASVIKPGSSTVQVAVQVPTFPKQRYESATLFQTQQVSVV